MIYCQATCSCWFILNRLLLGLKPLDSKNRISNLKMPSRRAKRYKCSEPDRASPNNKFTNLKLTDIVSVKAFAQGAWGRIELVHIKNEPTCCFAMKKINRSKLTQSVTRRHVFNEKEILSSIKNDFIVEFHRTFRDKRHLYIMTEWCPGGDLLNWNSLDEVGSLFYVGCIVEALEYLHARNIVHRDLKPNNCVLDGRGYLKLIDFGVAKRLDKDGRTNTFCGTLKYCPPEMLAVRRNSLAKGYDVAVDLWALGLVVFEFLVGIHPMYSRNHLTVCKKIMDGIDATSFPKHVSRESVDFIKQLCRNDPERRLGYGPGGFDNLRNHSWFRNLDVDALRRKTLQPPFVPKLDSVMDTRYFTGNISEEVRDDSLDAEFDPAWANDF